MSQPVTTLRAAREIALRLPEAVEADHFGRPSFRVGGRIFATVPDSDHLNVMIDAFDVEAVLRTAPEACEELWWGKRLSGVRLALGRASTKLVGDLLEAAWRRRAPRRLSSPSAPAAPDRRKSQTRRRSARRR